MVSSPYPLQLTLNQFPSAPQKVRNKICADSVHYRHIQSDLLSKCNPAVEHSASRHLPAMSWQFQDPSQQFPFHLSTGLHPAFYSAMLCMRGTSHGPVSVCVCHKSVLKRLNTGSHKQNHMIAKFDFCFLIPKISAKFDRATPYGTPNTGRVGKNRRLSTNSWL